MGDREIFRWLLDVRDLWPAPKQQSKDSTARWAAGQEVTTALSHLPVAERTRVLRFYHPRDAKLCLGSNLLKHRAITDACKVSWDQAIVSEDHNRKPCYQPAGPDGPRLEFNVSHHGTLVALVGCAGSTRKLGTDIVQMNWEKDYPAVQQQGFAEWVNTYEAVFSNREVRDIIAYSPASSEPQEQIREKLRHFYAHWSLREAYVKMTGEALLAPWLKDLEFRNVQVPLTANQLQLDKDSDWGQICTDYEIWFKGKRETTVKTELQAFREDYMIATAASEPHMSLSPFRQVYVADLYP